MAVVDTLTTRVTMDAKGYQAGAASVSAAAKKAKKDAEAMEKRIKRTGGMIAGAFAKALLAGTAALVGFGMVASRQAAEFDGLVKALEAVEGSAGRASKQMERLKEIAKAPGLGFEEAVRGFTSLRNVGLTQDFSERALSAFAVANARAGGGKDEFGRILTAVGQIAASPTLRGQEVLQLQNAGLPVRQVLRDAFGSADTAELAKQGVTSAQALEALVSAFEKQTRVTDSAKNSLENFGQAAKFAMVSIGTGINAVVMGGVQSLTSAIENVTQAGAFQSVGENLGTVFTQLVDALVGDNSLEDVILDFAAGVMAAADVIRNAWLNIVDLYNASPLAWMANTVGDAMKMVGITDRAAGTSFEMHRGTLDMQMELSRKRKKDPMAEAAEGAGQVFEEGKDPSGALGEAGNAVKGLLERIADNTGRAVELQRMALGGGDIGRFGVTPTELSGMRRKVGSRQTYARSLTSPMFIGPALFLTKQGGR